MHHRPRSHTYNHPSSYREDDFTVVHGISESFRDMTSYIIDVRPEEYRSRRSRTMVPEPILTSVSMGIGVQPIIPDTPDILEREPTPRFHYGEEVIYDSDIFKVVSKPVLVRSRRGDTFEYLIRHKHERESITARENELKRVPRRLYETGATVKYESDGRSYKILGAAFLPQQWAWDYHLVRRSTSDRSDVERNAFEQRLTRVNSDDMHHLTPPHSRHSPTGTHPSPKGSFSSLVDIFRNH
ncbi:hypothetical protein ABW19_dt0208576 [Dactylella cylindrospora]|nr:hypothetical protein ABW19_dt0208576 [Dactylella cylindrospora]